MRSKLLSTVFDDPEASNAKRFERHLRETMSLTEVHRNRCIAALSDVKSARTDTQTKLIVEALAEETGVSHSILEHALSILSFWTDALISDSLPGEDYSLWCSDLSDLGWIDDGQRSEFNSMLDRLIDLSSEMLLQSKERSATGGVFPRFQSMGCTVELRPIRKRLFRWGESVEGFQPEILGTVLIASVSIGVDDGPVRDFYFQADETDIDNIIDSFRAAKKEMAAFREHIRLDQLERVNPDG